MRWLNTIMISPVLDVSQFLGAAMGTTTPVVTQTRAPAKRRDIQGLRAIAVLAVIGFHAGLPIPGGFIGVDIFFVISGFVITQMLVREKELEGRVHLRSFYWRRFKRLAPALSLMLTVCLLIGIPLLSPFGSQEIAATTAIAATFSLANISIARTFGDYFGTSAEGNLFLNTWSLSVEEQFYLVFPVLLVASWVVGRRVKDVKIFGLIVVALISGLSFAAAVVGASGYSLDRYFWIVGFFSPVTRAWEFGIGALVALLCGIRCRPSLMRVSQPASIVGALMVVGALVFMSESTPWPGPWTLVPVLGTALLLAAGVPNKPNPIAKSLQSQPLVAIGDASYSLYLWHWPFIVLAVATWGRSPVVTSIAVLVSVLPALASYRWIENPLRVRRLETPVAKIVLVLLVLCVPLIVAVSVNRGAESQWGLPIPERPLFGAGSTALADCMRFARRADSSPLLDDACLFGKPQGGKSIYLVGDSQAAQWADALDQMGRSVGASVRVATAPGCPFIDVYKASPAGIGAADWACRESYENTMSVLLGLPPGDVVIAQSPGYWLDENVEVAATVSGPRSAASKHQFLNQGLNRSTAMLQQAGHRVFVVVPLLSLASEDRGPMPSSCTTLMLYQHQCFRSIPASDVSGQRRTLQAVGGSLSDGGIRTIDLFELQCRHEVCGLWSGDVPVYSDNSHVSAEFSRLATLWFLRAMYGTPRGPSPEVND